MESVYFVEVSSIHEVARLACAFESIPMPIFALDLDGPILAVQSEPIKDKIVFYYARCNEYSEFIAYKCTRIEDVKFTDSTIDATYTYAPIILIKEFPRGWLSSELVDERCSKIVLKDLNSLAKICGYKTLVYEMPTSLFHLNNLLGTFISFDDVSTYFYCVELEEEPSAKFLRYSSVKSQSSFANNTEEHGYTYNKIIKLKNGHPLVDV